MELNETQAWPNLYAPHQVNCSRRTKHSTSTSVVMNSDRRKRSSSCLLEPVEQASITGVVCFTALPDDIVSFLGTYLDVDDLNACRLVNRRFRSLMSMNGSGWVARCAELWGRKVHVHEAARAILHYIPSRSTQAMKAYHASCIDGRSRNEIRIRELCFDPTNSTKGTIWYFRFKECAGSDWTALDPWHNGGDARRMVFLKDGSIKQIEASDSKSESGKKPILRVPFCNSNGTGGLEMRWRFVSKPLDLPMRKEGAYLRLEVGGREVPSFVVRRSPNGNWGFIMENCWSIFASFPLLRKKSSSCPSDKGRMPSSRGNSSENDFLGDSSLSLTNGWQWREALLYNLGASTLPENDEP